MSTETFVRSVSDDEFRALVKKFTVDPNNYTKRVRMYIDVDGVILPQSSAFNKVDVSKLEKTDIFYLKTMMGAGTQIHKDFVYYNPTVMAKISEWSHNPNVDVVWTTSWRISAPFSFDEKFNIRSVGYLYWQEKFSDYSQVFKGVAIREEQEEYPSQFVWIDDIANKVPYSVPEGTPYFTRLEEDDDEGYSKYTVYEDEEEIEIPPHRYLAVTPESHVGLTSTEIQMIDDWLTAQES